MWRLMSLKWETRRKWCRGKTSNETILEFHPQFIILVHIRWKVRVESWTKNYEVTDSFEFCWVVQNSPDFYFVRILKTKLYIWIVRLDILYIATAPSYKLFVFFSSSTFWFNSFKPQTEVKWCKIVCTTKIKIWQWKLLSQRRLFEVYDYTNPHSNTYIWYDVKVHHQIVCDVQGIKQPISLTMLTFAH